eukprot:3175270-Karenia_brevis.AAC.1
MLIIGYSRTSDNAVLQARTLWGQFAKFDIPIRYLYVEKRSINRDISKLGCGNFSMPSNYSNIMMTYPTHQ